MVVIYEILEGTAGNVAGRCIKVLAGGKAHDWTCVPLSAADAVLKGVDHFMTKVVDRLNTK
jgi:hypothetical protein